MVGRARGAGRLGTGGTRVGASGQHQGAVVDAELPRFAVTADLVRSIPVTRVFSSNRTRWSMYQMLPGAGPGRGPKAFRYRGPTWVIASSPSLKRRTKTKSALCLVAHAR